MQFEHLAELRAEFKKFTGFMIADAISEPASKAVALLSSPEGICLPIEDVSCPIVQAFSAILHHKKAMRGWPSLISAMCPCIATDAITGDALLAVMQAIESVSDLVDSESGMRVLQLAASTVTSKFLEITLFHGVLSVVFSFCASKVQLLQTAALACVEQILSSFVVFCETQGDHLAPGTVKDIDECFAKNCEATVTFEKPMYPIVYLVLRDLARLCNEEAAVWIHNYPIGRDVSFAMVEHLVGQHAAVFEKSSHFLQLIAITIKAAEKRKAPLSFSVTIMDNMMEAMPKECLEHFQFFVGCLHKEHKMQIRALQFFRIFLMKRPTVLIRFFKNCDPEAKVLSSLMERLKDFTDVTIGKEPVALSLNPIGYDAPGPRFMSSAPVEIAAYCVQSCSDSKDPAIVKLITSIWSDIIAILSISLTCVTGESCYVLMQNLHMLIVLSSELKMDDIRGMVIAAFCSVLMSPNEGVRKTGYDTLTYAVESSPGEFVGYWSRVLTALADFQWEPNTKDFVVSLSLSEVVEIAVALVDIHDERSVTRGWALNLLSNILIANDSRFGDIWEPIKEKYLHLFDSDETLSDEILDSFLLLMHQGFTSQSEKLICEAINEIMKKPNVPKDVFLENVKDLVSQQGPTIQEGWMGVLEAFSPDNLDSNTEYVNLAFRCVTVVSNDVLFIVPEEVQNKCISVIFEFAAQQVDVNVSLAAFGLLWNVISIAKTASMWIAVFRHHVPLISDPRGDVSLCAVKTMFSLIMSNWQTLPEEVFGYLGTECLPKIVEGLAHPPPDSHATQQLAFHEIAHCGRTLWSHFREMKWFTFDLWNGLLDLHSEFMQNCQKRESVVAAFQFYEEVFQCDELCQELRAKLFDKLDILTDFLIRTESPRSSLFGAFGRMILMILPTQKKFLDDATLDRWLAIIRRPVFDLDCTGFLPPTAHKTLSALCALFPLPQHQAEKIYKLFVSMAVNPMDNARLRDVAIEHIYDLCKEIPDEMVPNFFVISTPLFTLRPARRLLLFFIEKDMQINDDMVSHVCSSLIELGNSEPELTVKTGIGILKLFLRLDDQQKLEFIDAQASCYETQTSLWSEYLSPESPKFDEPSAMLCTTKVVTNIGNFLPVSEDDKLLEVLDFLRQAKSLGRAFGETKQGTCRHINSLIPLFADLVIHPNEEIRKLLREIFLLLADD